MIEWTSNNICNPCIGSVTYLVDSAMYLVTTGNSYMGNPIRFGFNTATRMRQNPSSSPELLMVRILKHILSLRMVCAHSSFE